MAIIEKLIGAFGEEVKFYITYDDTTNLLRSLRCNNQGNSNAYGEATQLSNGRTAGKIFLSNTDTNIPIGTNAAVRLQLYVNPNGKIDGVEYHLMYPDS